MLEALRAETALHPDAPRVAAQVDGRLMQRNYNQVVHEVWRGELERSPLSEMATWEELEAAHLENETAPCRCVGLVIETRPDHISEAEVLRVRRLGCTKVQIGIQSLNDAVLAANRRGHDVAATRRALRLLRRAGFKIHAHWMPNLYGSTPEADILDYARLFDEPDFRPDELKIYPCSLIESAELMQRYEDGSWRPYSHDELLAVLTACLRRTPEYCRLTRIIRDIPSTDIVVGNQLTNFRQIAEEELAQQGERSRDIRAREIRQRQVRAEAAAARRAALPYILQRGSLPAIHYATARHRGFSAFVVANGRAAHGRTARRGHGARGACLRPVAAPGRGRRRQRAAPGAGHAIARARG